MMLRKAFYTFLLSMAVVLAGCGSPSTPPTMTPIPTTESGGRPIATFEFAAVEQDFVLTSSAFEQGAPIPEKYSCKGNDISPPLEWVEPPAGTQSFALIVDDPDAPISTWDHWIVFNIPADVRSLPEAMSSEDVTATFGNNSWKRADYGGPCPPSGTHRYFFRLYALDTTLSLPEGASKKDVQDAMNGHTLAIAELMGTFSK